MASHRVYLTVLLIACAACDGGGPVVPLTGKLTGDDIAMQTKAIVTVAQAPAGGPVDEASIEQRATGMAAAATANAGVGK